MNLEIITAFVVFAFVTSVTPGPNNFMLMTSGTLFGMKRTLPHMLGVVTGFASALIAVIFGIVLILEKLPWLTWTVRLVGTAWLAWLGATFILSARRLSDSKEDRKETRARPIRFYEAYLFQWANPKGIVMATSAASAFIEVAPTAAGRALIMSLCFFASGVTSSLIWTVSGSALSGFLKSDRRAQIVQSIMGALLILTAIGLLFV
jgi:threonine/homoserine/homoserine lactone efflux protein